MKKNTAALFDMKLGLSHEGKNMECLDLRGWKLQVSGEVEGDVDAPHKRLAEIKEDGQDV
jgi:hypothetical protein